MNIHRIIPRALAVLVLVSVSGVLSAVAASGHDAEFNQALTQLSDANVSARENAAVALGNLGDKRAVEPLIAMLQNKYPKSSNHSVARIVVGAPLHFAFVTALTGGLGTVRAVKDTYKEDIKPIDETVHFDEWENRPVRAEAARALGKLGDQRAVEPLIVSLHDGDAGVGAAAASALGALGDPRALAPLMILLQAPYIDAGIRVAVANALGQLKPVSLIPRLIGLLNNSDYSIRINALEALAQIGEPAGQSLLIEMDRSDLSISMQASIIEKLGRMGDKRAIPRLIVALGDSQTRMSAAAALDLLGEPFGRIFLLAIQGNEDAMQKLVIQHDARAAELLPKTLKDENPSIRNHSAALIARVGGKEAVEPLIQLLEDSDASVRATATIALGKIPDSRAVEPLIRMLQDSEINVRRQAAVALGDLADPRAIGPLLPLIGYESQVREDAGAALVKIGQPAVQPLLAEALRTDSKNRKTLVYLLGCIGDKDAASGLATLLWDATVRVEIAGILEKFGDSLGTQWLKFLESGSGAVDQLVEVKDARIPELLLKTTRDQNPEVRAIVATALGRLLGPQGVDTLITLLRDENESVRSSAAIALGKLADVRALNPLISVLGDRNEKVRAASVWALAQLHDPAAMQSLTGLLDDPDDAVRQAVEDAFVTIGHTSLPALIQLLGIKDHPQRAVGAAKVLATIGGAECVGPLIQTLIDPEEKLRSAGAVALVQIGYPAVEPLIKTATDGDRALRSPAIILLGKLGDKRAIAPLIEMLSNRDVRGDAGKALEALGEPLGGAFLKTLQGDSSARAEMVSNKDPRYGMQLVKVLKDKDVAIQKNAALALGQMGDEQVVDWLISALSDGDSGVRTFAAQWLGRTGNAHAVEPLIRCLADRDGAVTSAAGEALQRLPRPMEAVQYSAILAGSWNWFTRLRAGRYLVEEPRWLSPTYWRACGRMLLDWGSLSYSLPALVLGAGVGSLWHRRLRGSVPGFGGWLVLLNIWLALCLCVPIMRLAGGWTVLMGLALVPSWISLCVGALVGLSRWPMAKKRMEGFVCRDHFLRFHPGPALNWLTRWSGRWLVSRPNARGNLADACICPICAKSKGNRFEGVREVVAVLDNRGAQYPQQQDGVLRVNWLKQKRPFDFDSVEVNTATDDDVAEFVRQTRFDSDIAQQKRLQKMHCSVNAQCRFQRNNTMIILKQTFGCVASE